MNPRLRYRVTIAAPRDEDARRFITAVSRSTELHRPWAQPPQTDQAYKDYLQRSREDNQAFFTIWLREPQEIVGVVNLSEIVRGRLQSAYLGFYGMKGFTRLGYMTEGVSLVLRHAFRDLRLHRVEANVQPGNNRSLALLARVGFRKEGFSPRYLKLSGKWKDHERWAILREEWSEEWRRCE